MSSSHYLSLSCSPTVGLAIATQYMVIRTSTSLTDTAGQLSVTVGWVGLQPRSNKKPWYFYSVQQRLIQFCHFGICFLWPSSDIPKVHTLLLLFDWLVIFSLSISLSGAVEAEWGWWGRGAWHRHTGPRGRQPVWDLGDGTAHWR